MLTMVSDIIMLMLFILQYLVFSRVMSMLLCMKASLIDKYLHTLLYQSTVNLEICAL